MKGLFTLFLLLGAYAMWIWPRSADIALGHENFAVTADGANIAFYKSGPPSGSTVLLLSSLGRSVSDFNHLIASLNTAGYYTIAVDVRGVGNSTFAPEQEHMTLFDLVHDIELTLHQAVVEKDKSIAVIGHAFGNRLARAFATMNADRVNSIVLIAAGGAQKLKAEQRQVKALRNSFNWTLFPPKRVTEIKYAFFADNNQVPSSWKRGWYSKSAKLQVAAVKATPLSSWRSGGGVAPILVIQASMDRIAPAELTSTKLLADYPERVTVVTINQAGHALLPEQPKALEHSIIHFLNLNRKM